MIGRGDFVRKVIPLIFAGFILLAVGLSFARNGNGLVFTGTVEADQIDICSEISGIIKELPVEEGAEVDVGTTLAGVDTKTLELQLAQAEAVLKIAEAALEEVENGARYEEIKGARATVQNYSAALEGARANYQYRLDTYQDMEELYNSSGVSRKQLDDAKAQLDAAHANLESLEGQKEAAEAKLEMLLNGPTGQRVNMARAEVDQAKSQVELLKYQVSKGKIISPVKGTVQTIMFEEGEMIPSGGNLLTIIDRQHLWVKIYIPVKELHRVSLGQRLKLSADVEGGKEYTGEIVHISTEAEFTPKNVESKENKQEMVCEVKIKIIQKDMYIKPGMLMDVTLGDDDND